MRIRGLLPEVNLYEILSHIAMGVFTKHYKANCETQQTIDGVTGDVKARRCAHVSWQFGVPCTSCFLSLCF